MNDSRMIKFSVPMLFLVGLISNQSCRMKVGANLSEDRVEQAISISLRHSGLRNTDEKELVFGTGVDVTELVVCRVQSAPDVCNRNTVGNQPSLLVHATKTRRFFQVVRTTGLYPGLTLRAVGFNASGIAVAQRDFPMIRYLPTASPTPSSSPQTNLQALGNSGGSGGVTGRVVENQSFTSSEGVQATFRYFAPAGNNRDTGHPLVVYLNGNTGSNFGPKSTYPQTSGEHGQSLPTLDQARNEAAQESWWNQAVFVSVLSPTRNQSVLTWETDLDASVRAKNARLVHELVQNNIFRNLNINRDQVFFVGQSGGAVFLGGSFIPLFGTNYRGGALMLCGGSPPKANFTVAPTEEFKRLFKIHFQWTAREMPELIPLIKGGIDYYRKAINNDQYVTASDVGQGEHCIFNTSQPSIIAPVIRSMMNLNKELLR
jgi:hypothetical protein